MLAIALCAPWLVRAAVFTDNPRWRPAGAAVAALCGALAILSLPPVTERHERDRSGYTGHLTHVVRETPLPYLPGDESREAYLDRRVRPMPPTALSSGWRVPACASSPSPSRYRVAGIEHVPEYAACLDGVRAAGGDDGQVLRRLRELGVTHVMWDTRRRGEAQELRIADPAFERRHLRLVHRDERTLVFAVRGRPEDRPAGRGAPTAGADGGHVTPERARQHSNLRLPAPEARGASSDPTRKRSGLHSATIRPRRRRTPATPT